MFKLDRLRPDVHTCSDLSLAKRLVITFNRSYIQKGNLSRDYNTIDCSKFFKLVGALSPKLADLLIRTDGTSRPSTSLFDIGQDLRILKQITAVAFVQIGSIVAEYNSEGFEPSPKRFTIKVEYKALVVACEYFDGACV